MVSDWIEIIKKRRVWLICAAVVLALAAAGIWLEHSGRDALTSIDIRADYLPDGETRAVEVAQTISYKNLTGGPLEEVVLHLYPLAYASEETVPVAPGEMGIAYPEGFQAGGAQIEGIEAEGKPCEYEVEGTIIRVPLEKPLGSGKTAKLALRYTLTVPEGLARFGAQGEAVNLLNAFAIPAVYGPEGWRTDAYTPIGDPFYSETANYTATISAPEGTSIAATGAQKNAKVRDGRVTARFEAPNVRDFAAVLATDFITERAKVGDVQIISHAPTQKGAKLALEVAAQAVSSMSSLFGSSPYDEIEICVAGLVSGGMEYPGLAVIDRSLYEEGVEEALEYCIAHEVAHQWWYGGVGNDQIREPWLDESLAEYSTLLYFEKNYGAEGFQKAYRHFVRPLLLRPGLASKPIERSIVSFSDPGEYASVVYAKGAAMWHALRQEMGDEAFFAALRRYYANNEQSLADKQSLYASLGGEWAAFVEEWLTGRAPEPGCTIL